MSKIKSWCRANAMLVISLLAAVVTAFFVPPDRDYLGYYDLKTLACLFCVLAVVGALRDLHIFSALSQRMVHTFSTVRGVCTALVVITMFGSMLLTNDTALLTFLPLGWFVLSSTGQEKHTALLFILQNCAANLCGMITPFLSAIRRIFIFSAITVFLRRRSFRQCCRPSSCLPSSFSCAAWRFPKTGFPCRKHRPR